ncbi:MAG TPA: hypothetical protein VMW55_09120 [Nitrosopumilaceae archaeon]|jgi:hypothetical protein|nr:hypothetical protein [Nitrosopumilaceae archaeon]
MIQKPHLEYDEKDLVMGIAPGEQIDLSIFYFGKEIESSVFSSIDELVLYLIGILGNLRVNQKIIKIGNRDMDIAKNRKIT